MNLVWLIFLCEKCGLAATREWPLADTQILTKLLKHGKAFGEKAPIA